MSGLKSTTDFLDRGQYSRVHVLSDDVMFFLADFPVAKEIPQVFIFVDNQLYFAELPTGFLLYQQMSGWRRRENEGESGGLG